MSPWRTAYWDYQEDPSSLPTRWVSPGTNILYEIYLISCYAQDSIFIVEALLQVRKKATGVEYLVKWVGFKETTWEPCKNLKAFIVRVCPFFVLCLIYMSLYTFSTMKITRINLVHKSQAQESNTALKLYLELFSTSCHMNRRMVIHWVIVFSHWLSLPTFPRVAVILAR